jgi:hypothetical protein
LSNSEKQSKEILAMANFLAEVKEFFDGVKSAPARERGSFTISTKDAVSFVERDHYLQILVNEMYLSKEREWWVRYAPVAFVATTYLYGTEYQTAPIVVGPSLFQQYSKDVGDGTIIRNAPVTSLHPYQGGALTLTVIFSKVERQDNSEKVLDVLESFTNVASPLAPVIPFDSYLKIAGSVMSGMRVLLNLPKTKPVVAYRETINPQLNQSRLDPMHIVLIDAPNPTDHEKKRFRVKNSQLFYGDSDVDAVPYRKSDFILLEIAQGTKRTDERTLAFYPLWEQTRKLGQQSAKQDGFWQEAKAHFNTLKIAINESPELTRPDIKRLTSEYFNDMKEIRLGGAEEQQLSVEPQSAETLKSYQEIARQLDELDEL